MDDCRDVSDDKSRFEKERQQSLMYWKKELKKVENKIDKTPYEYTKVLLTQISFYIKQVIRIYEKPEPINLKQLMDYITKININLDKLKKFH